MTTQTIEQAVEELSKDWLFAGDEPKEDDFGIHKEFKDFMRKALQAQRDAGAREALEWVISLEDEMHSTLTIEMTNQTEMDKGYILYQDMVLNIIKLAKEKLKALTPPTK
jgi:hypothetical protein